MQQVTPTENLDDHSTLPTSNTWTCEQNNTNNAYYVIPSSGQVNNNNKNNSYAVLTVAESDEQKLLEALFDAESDCWANKKSRLDAARFHFHLAEIFDLHKMIWDRTYKPTTSICFVLTYPRYREVFAAMYRDRVVHHLIAPFILKVTEAVHYDNGNISHGNRPKRSAQTAAEQIQMNMRKYPNGFVATMDVSGFFMNICRDMAYDTFVKFCKKFRPDGYTDEQVEVMLWILHTLIHHDPTSDCERHSPISMWDFIAANKTIFGNEGKGLPIGNFYSQLIANLVLSVWGSAIKELGVDCEVTQFVDDMCIVAASAEIIHAVRKRSMEILEEMKLTLHPKKFYIQPVRHGVQFCGRVIYTNRMYINNRTVRACKNSIRLAIQAGASIENAQRLLNSYNSYVGFMCHLQSYKIQYQLMKMILDSPYHDYLYFIEKKNQLVCRMFDMYKPRARHMQEIKDLKRYYKQTT